MAMTTTADLSSVGISLDHIACTSGPLLLPQHGDHPHHRGFGGGLSPECRISSPSLSGPRYLRFPQPAVVSLTAGTEVALVFQVFLCGQARMPDLDRLRCSLAAGHPEDGATDHVWWMCFTRRGPGAPCARTKRAQESLVLTADRRPACLVHLLRRWTVV